MSYFMIKVTQEDNQQTQSILRYETAQQATMAFHQEMAAAMAYPTVQSALCMVMNEYGVTSSMERYEREEAPAPEAVK